jgi:Four helix bundle sensory module for signal transduction
MGGFLQTIRFKIMLALGLCVALMATIGLFGIGGLSKLNSNMSETYSEAVLPIAYLAHLANVRGAEFSLRGKLGALAMTHTSESAAKILPELDEDMATIDKVWPDYYPAKVSHKENDCREASDPDRCRWLATVIDWMTSATSARSNGPLVRPAQKLVTS